MNIPKLSSQSGSSLFIILIAVALFAALSYAMSQSNNATASLSSEKIRLLASDVIDMGNKRADAVSRLRLKGVKNTQLSFENPIVDHYDHAGCVTDKCRVFAYDGGGLDWETPASEVNTGSNWAFTGDLAIQNVGTTEADLVAILPDLSLTLCNRINMLLGVYDATGTPPNFTGIGADKFVGAYIGVPVNISNALIQGRKSACIKLTSSTGTAFSALASRTFYAYYQVLEER